MNDANETDAMWRPVSTAPIGRWVEVKTDALPHPLIDEDGAPWWEYGSQVPPPVVVVAIFDRPSAFGLTYGIGDDQREWRVFSADGGLYGRIARPTHWREVRP